MRDAATYPTERSSQSFCSSHLLLFIPLYLLMATESPSYICLLISPQHNTQLRFTLFLFLSPLSVSI
jgi:hypothetical protein